MKDLQIKLGEAHEMRRARADEIFDRQIEDRLDQIGLSEEKIALGTADVSPQAREKLKGILKRLAGQAHPFTQCMKDLKKHKPEWSDERRKKTCSVLKTLSGRGNSGGAKSKFAEGACVLLTDDVADLLELADDDALKALMTKQTSEVQD